MQLLILALVLALFIHDTPELMPEAAGAGGWSLVAWWLVPSAVLLALYAAACTLVRRRLSLPSGARWLKRLDIATRVFRYGVLACYIVALSRGVLTWLRSEQAIGDLVLVDELLFMLPALSTLAGGWWCYYPIERRLREAAMIGRIDAGLPIYPVWSRPQYLLAQFRHQMAIILAPLMLMLAWYELVGLWFASTGDDAGAGVPLSASINAGGVPALLTVGGAGCVFLLAPVMVRHIWDTAALPDGELRTRLTRLCRQYRVRFREVLLWRTFGGMVNAAVMGMLAPLRYILLSDALLEHLPAEQVEAVMAHEVAHIRKRHLVWLLVLSGSAMVLLQLVCGLTVSHAALVLAEQDALAFARDVLTQPAVHQVTALTLAGVFWIAIFGWVSRQFERQADSFAVAHLARRRAWQNGEAPPVIDARSVQTMVDALQQVALLNHISPAARSWRHGSIVWRQNYLRTLEGQPADDLRIDRRVRWINAVGVASIIALLALWQYVDASSLFII